MTPIDALVDDFLEHHFSFRPVDATFMGIEGYDDRLPPSDEDAPDREAAGLAGISASLSGISAPPHGAAAVEHSILSSHLKHATRALVERSHYRDPTWYTGEAAFGIISLLLPSAGLATSQSLSARLAAIPGYLAGGRRHLLDGAVHHDWVVRARHEARAMVRLLGRGIRLHQLWQSSMSRDAEAAAAAFAAFDVALADLSDADPAAGADYLAFIMRDVHQLDIGIKEAEAFAAERFAKLGEELVAAGRKLDPERSWRDQLADLDRERPQRSILADTYRYWHERVLDGAGHLVTPASDFGLEFRPLPDWAQDVFGDTYFLSYRSPPAYNTGSGSVYWLAGNGQNVSTIKQTHAIHHASIGHHTHNARARAAPSRLARLAETGVARGVAFLTAGTTGEGWACHAQHLAAEIPGILNPVETEIMLRDMERRNAGALLADIRLHTGRWTLAEMRRFYTEEGGFGAGRVWGETVRNSIFPGTRLMYWLGQEAIRAARAAWKGSDSSFHDALIGCGHPTIGVALREIAHKA